ncbi:hypothetical protein [Thiomonas delicata]|uniref:hypothetical protein n=1 Tax=Thiomonas delicata TaxID=364030 RepID=UPI001FE46C28|nr:hypothetical protein [Thiomonas delicata]
MDELFSERDVVIGMLAVAGSTPTGFQEGEGQQRTVRRRSLEVGEQAEVAVRSAGDVGEGVTLLAPMPI